VIRLINCNKKNTNTDRHMTKNTVQMTVYRLFKITRTFSLVTVVFESPSFLHCSAL